MKIFIFAWYSHLPAACEGDDPLSQIRVIRLRLKSDARVDRAIRILELRFGGYVQWWE